MYRILFRLGVDGSPSFLTNDNSDPLDWDNQVAEFENESDAIEFMDCAYDALTRMDAYANDWKSIVLDVVEVTA